MLASIRRYREAPADFCREVEASPKKGVAEPTVVAVALLRKLGIVLLLRLGMLLIAPAHAAEQGASPSPIAALLPASPAIAPPTAPTAAARAAPLSRPPCAAGAGAAAGGGGGLAGSKPVCCTAQA